MDPSDDVLYQIHQFQAARRRVPPLDYDKFTLRLPFESDTDLSQVFLPDVRSCLKPFFSIGRIGLIGVAVVRVPWDDVIMAMAKHEHGKWGEVSPKQWLANDLAVANGGRICSAYYSSCGDKFWLITSADRRHTTVLMPEDTWFPGGIP